MSSDDLAPVWHALADPTRRRILDLLRQRPRTTGELDAAFDMTRFGVMKHLRVLEGAGLVVWRKRGRERWNHLNPVPIQRIWERWIRHYDARWAGSLTALQRHVEAGAKGEAVMSELRSIHVEAEAVIEAACEQVWHALVADTRAWWGAPYHRGAAQDIELDAQPGGLLLERWADGGGAVWGTVTGLEPERLLEITGPVGMPGPVAGVVRISLEPRDGTTVVRLSHEAAGRVDEDTQRGYGLGWEDLLGVRLKAFVEEGTRYGVGHEPPATAPALT